MLPCRSSATAAAFVGLLVVLALAPGDAAAKMYKWKDAEGNVHYTQTPPPESAQQGKQLNVRTGSTVTVRKRGKDHYCGDRRLPKVSTRPATAIANLNSSLLGWEDSIERVREAKEKYIKRNAKRATTTGFNDALRKYDEQVAEYQCQVTWGRQHLESLEDDKAKILEHHARLEELQADVEKRKLANCGAERRTGVVVVDDAYRAYKSCIRPYDRELSKLRKTLRRSRSDVKLVSD